ncbi:MAG: APC family permease [Gemmatimonadota bacterium]
MTAAPIAPAAPIVLSDADAKLRRVIGPGTIALNAMNVTIASGIFALPAVISAIIGPAAVYAYLICGAAMALVLLCYAELGSTTLRSGGGYAYIERSFGPFWAFLAGVLLWFAFGVLSNAAIATAIAQTVGAAFPAFSAPLPRALLLIAYFAVIIAVNIIGTRAGARVAVVLTVIKLVPLVVLVVAAIPSLKLVAITGGGLPPMSKLGEASLILFFAFTGAEAALTPSGEIANVRRDVPRGIMLGCAGVILVYLAVHVAAESLLGGALATSGAAPLAAAAEIAMGPAGATLLLVGGVISMVASNSGDMLATPRCMFASAVDGQLPAVLARVHPTFRTPWVAILVYGGLCCVLAIAGGFAWLAALASAGLLLVYFGVCLAVLRERMRAKGAEATGFRIPGGPLVPVAGMLLVAALLANANAAEWKPLIGLLAVSSVYCAGRRLMTSRAVSST